MTFGNCVKHVGYGCLDSVTNSPLGRNVARISGRRFSQNQYLQEHEGLYSMKFKYLLAASAVSITASALVAAPAAAQSTGSVDFEDADVIVVSGARVTDIGGVDIPDSPKAK
jgi:hypothetical protein